jgi:hypothetical protein
MEYCDGFQLSHSQNQNIENKTNISADAETLGRGPFYRPGHSANAAVHKKKYSWNRHLLLSQSLPPRRQVTVLRLGLGRLATAAVRQAVARGHLGVPVQPEVLVVGRGQRLVVGGVDDQLVRTSARKINNILQDTRKNVR